MDTGEKDWFAEEGIIQHGMIRIVHRYFAIVFRQITKFGIHPGQIPVLMLLVKKEGLSQSEICREMHIKPSTVAVSMKRMEKNGLIIRRPDEKDQRIQRIYGTEKLKKMHHELHILIRNNEAFMMKGFTESEICLLNRFFEQIYQNLDKIPVSDLCDMCEKEEESDND